jgi:hypothetical protein
MKTIKKEKTDKTTVIDVSGVRFYQEHNTEVIYPVIKETKKYYSILIESGMAMIPRDKEREQYVVPRLGEVLFDKTVQRGEETLRCKCTVKALDEDNIFIHYFIET